MGIMQNVLTQTWPRGYKTISCLTQLSMKIFLLINLRLLTIANSFLLNIAEHDNFSVDKYENIFSSRKNSMLS